MKYMKLMFAVLMCAAGWAQAADEKAAAPAAEKKLTASQQRMVDCNKEAGDKRGDARRDFMRQCMHGGAAPAKMTQQEKMKQCNAQAGEKSLKGPERKTFMSDCLKAK